VPSRRRYAGALLQPHKPDLAPLSPGIPAVKNDEDYADYEETGLTTSAVNNEPSIQLKNLHPTKGKLHNESASITGRSLWNRLSLKTKLMNERLTMLLHETLPTSSASACAKGSLACDICFFPTLTYSSRTNENKPRTSQKLFPDKSCHLTPHLPALLTYAPSKIFATSQPLRKWYDRASKRQSSDLQLTISKGSLHVSTRTTKHIKGQTPTAATSVYEAQSADTSHFRSSTSFALIFYTICDVIFLP
jgi:hypothetical protein